MPITTDKGKLRPSDNVLKIYNRYYLGMQVIQKPEAFFNNRTPLEYWADGRLRFNVYVPQRQKNSKMWRTLYRSAMLRNKILGIVAHVLGMMPEPSIIAQNENQQEDINVSKFFQDFVDWSMDHEGFEVKAFWGLVTAVAEGTIVMKDDYGKFERTVKEIIEIDEQTGKIKYKENKNFVDFVGAFTEIVPNDEFLIGNPYITSLQDQPWIIRRHRLPIDVFRHKYQKYDRVMDVKPGMPQAWVYSSDFFQPYTSVTYLAANIVEVVEYWEKNGDHYDVVANGVQLTEDENPNPRPDKMYPFCKSGFEPIDYSFFWYKSLADKLSPEQDVYDAVLRMAIDAVHLNLIKPVATNNPALVNEDIAIPGNVIYTGAADNYKIEPVFGNVPIGMDAGTSNILNTMMTNMAQSSLDPMQTGSAPSGGANPTASQVLQMAQNAKIMLGLFGWMYGYLITEWTKLRCQTLLWRVSRDMDLSKVTIHDRVLKNGKMGKRTYIFERGLASRPKEYKDELSKKIKKVQETLGNTEEIIALDPEELANLDLFVKIGSEPKPKRTDAIMQALAGEKWNIKSRNPEIWNLNYAAVQLSNAWGENPDEAIQKPSESPAQGQPQIPGQSGISAQGAPASTGGTPIMNQLGNSMSSALGMQSKSPAMSKAL